MNRKISSFPSFQRRLCNQRETLVKESHTSSIWREELNMRLFFTSINFHFVWKRRNSSWWFGHHSWLLCIMCTKLVVGLALMMMITTNEQWVSVAVVVVIVLIIIIIHRAATQAKEEEEDRKSIFSLAPSFHYLFLHTVFLRSIGRKMLIDLNVCHLISSNVCCLSQTTILTKEQSFKRCTYISTKDYLYTRVTKVSVMM